MLYQRNRSRRLLDSANVLAQLRDQLKNQQQSMPDSSSPSQQQPSLTLQRDDKQWDIMEVMHDNDRSPCELAHILHDADVVITPHGFQAMLVRAYYYSLPCSAELTVCRFCCRRCCLCHNQRSSTRYFPLLTTSTSIRHCQQVWACHTVRCPRNLQIR